MPLSTYGYVHFYNNYFNSPNNTSGSVASDLAQFLSEYNVYTSLASPLYKKNVNTTLGAGKIRAIGNFYTNSTGTAIDAGSDLVFTPSYSYEMLPVSDVPTVLSTGAGNISGADYTDPVKGTATITGPTSPVIPSTSPTLTAVTTGFSARSYQWRLNNTDIAGASLASYTVANAQSANAGIYTVAIGLASDDVVISTPFVLTLASSPPNSGGSNSGGGGGGGALGYWYLLGIFSSCCLRSLLHILNKSVAEKRK
jgi:hypothetical protein